MEHEDRRTTLDRLNEHSHSRAADIGSAARSKQPTTLEKLEAATNTVGEAASTAKEGWEDLSISGGAVLATAAGAAPVVLGGVVAYGLTKAAIAYLQDKNARETEREDPSRGTGPGQPGGSPGGPDRPQLSGGPHGPTLSPGESEKRLALPPGQSEKGFVVHPFGLNDAAIAYLTREEN